MNRTQSLALATAHFRNGRFPGEQDPRTWVLEAIEEAANARASELLEMSKSEAIEIAKLNAQANPEGYVLQAGDKFEPHAWVIKAVQHAGARRPGMFELVSAMNEAFGNPKGDPSAIDGKRLLSQCKNIGKEYQELMAAFGIKVTLTYEQLPEMPENAEEDIRDALCDIIVFALGGHHFMGYDANTDMRSVIHGVMTRFCQNPDQLARTRAKFDAEGIRYVIAGEFPRVFLKSAFDQGDGEYPKGKFLKCVDYKKPTFYRWQYEQPSSESKKMIEQVLTDPRRSLAEHEERMRGDVEEIGQQMGIVPAPLPAVGAERSADRGNIQAAPLPLGGARLHRGNVGNTETAPGAPVQLPPERNFIGKRSPEELNKIFDDMSKTREVCLKHDNDWAAFKKQLLEELVIMIDSSSSEVQSLIMNGKAEVSISAQSSRITRFD